MPGEEQCKVNRIEEEKRWKGKKGRRECRKKSSIKVSKGREKWMGKNYRRAEAQ